MFSLKKVPTKKKTGAADYTTTLLYIVEKMNHLHKAKSGEPLFF
jgi:hypothetical protein